MTKQEESDQRWRVQRHLHIISDALLYGALLTEWPILGLGGIASSSLFWSPHAITLRHVALLIAVVASTSLPRAQLVDEWLVTAQSHFAPVAISPAFLLRPTVVPLIVIAVATRTRSSFLAILGSVLIMLLGIATYQFLPGFRPNLEAVGYVTCAIVASIECWNAWRVWRCPSRMATRAVVSAAVFVAATSIALWVSPRLPHYQRVAMWWPSTQTPEFKTPVDGFGWSNIGHFGDLPRLLRAAGYHVSRVTDLTHLDTEILILPPPFRTLRTDEVDAVRGFATMGGRVLLIGEHTNLEGVKDAFSPLLEGTGLSLNFDTTNAVFGDTTITLHGPHVRANPYLTHNRGASITLSGFRPSPLLRGSWWHSDFGDALAPERAFLGDSKLTRGDRIGNLVLAARTAFGQGEIVLWGDGSPFLNQNYPFNSRYILSLVQDLGGRVPLPWIGPCIAILIVALYAYGGTPSAAAVTILVSLIAPLRAHGEAPLPSSVAVISDHEQNDFSRDPFSDRGVTGLGVALSRMGFVPWVGDWTELSTSPRVLFVVNPVLVSAKTLQHLRAAAETGSTVVVAGAGDSTAFQRVAREFGASVAGAPLGSIQAQRFATYSAWRLDATQGEALVANETPVGTVISVGKGRIAILADSGFFLSKNLETETRYDAENQEFLKWLLATR